MVTRMRFRPVLVGLTTASFVVAAPSTAQTVDTAQQYLGANPARQETFVRRQINAQSTLAEQCAPGEDAIALRDFFTAWLDDHPQFFNRSAQLAFTRALADRCDGDRPAD